MFFKRKLTDLNPFMNNGRLNELRLTIYYMSPSVLTQRPVSEKDLIDQMHKDKIVISGERLEEYTDLISRLKKLELIPVNKKSGINARLLYLFETQKGKELFRVSMWGKGNSMFVNGVEVEENQILYEVIIPFVPDDVAHIIQRVYQ